MNEYRGYNLFKHIRNPNLRAWNRLNTIYNIKERHGDVVSVKYAEHIKEKDLKRVYYLAAKVETEGYENVRRGFIRSRFV